MDEGVKETWCERCDRFTPLLEVPLVEDGPNGFPWGDLLCGDCFSIRLTIQLSTAASMNGVKEAYCRTCTRFTPLLEEPLQKDRRNPFPWGNYVCSECSFILLTVRLNTSNVARAEEQFRRLLRDKAEEERKRKDGQQEG